MFVKAPELDILPSDSWFYAAGLCSWADWFESESVGNAKDSFLMARPRLDKYDIFYMSIDIISLNL